jgi:signal transduction histidine kinase
MHDGLAQLLGSLHLWAENAQLALNEKDLPGAEDSIQKIDLAAREASASLRDEILGLRDTMLAGRGFVQVLREYLKRYQRQWGIETQFHIVNHTDNEESIQLPNYTEAQLLRIIQESMTNVRRHANASLVTVTLVEEPPIFGSRSKTMARGLTQRIYRMKTWPTYYARTYRKYWWKNKYRDVQGTGTKLI